ncbi:homeo-like domain protein [Brucella thiophenivorans]|uniref:Homeo-like domain protein n=1 Tax=Brucella thiophenivorans TaxID=571255 RepID=A0A256G5I6_9HYPH|nr:homeo-like domain protein [Brucella thiophenivorans]
MLIVETISKIRRLAHVQGKTIKAICRELGVSRKVVRKVLRSEETDFKYARSRQPQPKLGPWRDHLDGILLANEAKASRERLTLIRIFEDLRDLGYAGGYDTVRRYARSWLKERGAVTAEAYVPLLLRTRRGLPVRLEPRDCRSGRCDDGGEGCAYPALPQPDDVCTGLSARDAGDGVRRA